MDNCIQSYFEALKKQGRWRNFANCEAWHAIESISQIVLMESNWTRADFRSGSDSKESACNVGDLGSIPGSGKCLRERTGNLFQYSCLENPMDRVAWWATVHGSAELDTTEWLTHTCPQWLRPAATLDLDYLNFLHCLVSCAHHCLWPKTPVLISVGEQRLGWRVC